MGYLSGAKTWTKNTPITMWVKIILTTLNLVDCVRHCTGTGITTRVVGILKVSVIVINSGVSGGTQCENTANTKSKRGQNSKFANMSWYKTQFWPQ
jgi:hypothetical protein